MSKLGAGIREEGHQKVLEKVNNIVARVLHVVVDANKFRPPGPDTVQLCLGVIVVVSNHLESHLVKICDDAVLVPVSSTNLDGKVFHAVIREGTLRDFLIPNNRVLVK